MADFSKLAALLQAGKIPTQEEADAANQALQEQDLNRSGGQIVSDLMAKGEDLKNNYDMFGMPKNPAAPSQYVGGANPQEDPALGPNGPSLFSRVTNRLKEEAAKGNIASPAGAGGIRKLAGKASDAISTSAASPLAQAVDPYGDGLNDAALKAAQEKAKQITGSSLMARASSTLAEALSKGAYKDNSGFADALSKTADADEKNILQRRDAKDKDLNRQKALAEMNDEAAMRDPNSPVSASIRDGMKKLFPALNLPANVSGKQLRDLGINFGTLIAAKEAADARRDAAMLRDSEKKEKDSKLSDKQVQGITDFDDSMDKMNAALTLLGKHSNWTGAADGRVPDMLVGGDQMAFRSAVGRMQDAYRKLITGAAASNQELARLESRLPSPTDTYENFQAKAKDFLREVKKARETHIKNYQKQGKKVEAFQDAPDAPSAGSDPRVDDFMKANGISDRNEAIKILKENGKI